MRKAFFILFILTSLPLFSQTVIQRNRLDANNISSHFWNTGVFNQNTISGNTAGFEWPKGSGKTAMFTAGLTMAAIINGQFAQVSASYRGEYSPGKMQNNTAYSDETFKLYKVSAGDNNSNPDYANWGLMVPNGAPYVDVNNNGAFDSGIDIPGVKDAKQTIFICMTDGFASERISGEGFGGGVASPLLGCEVHMTAWAYSTSPYLNDCQFIKYQIINKSNNVWDRTFFTFFVDPDLGNGDDDYIGCDVSQNLGYGYNATNNDLVYGTAPPAVGFLLLKGAAIKSGSQTTELGMTSFTNYEYSIPAYSCLIGNVTYSYNLMRGLKSDSSQWINPQTMQPTKYVFSGDPETGTGWNDGSNVITNCGGSLTGSSINYSAGNRNFILSTGSNALKVLPGEKQTIVLSQLIAQGTNNKNSVTRLKGYAEAVQKFYNENISTSISYEPNAIPDKFSLSQNYPNPFNPATTIDVNISSAVDTKLRVYDVNGKEVAILINGFLQPGSYKVSFNGANLPSGVYFYKLEIKDASVVKKMILMK